MGSKTKSCLWYVLPLVLIQVAIILTNYFLLDYFLSDTGVLHKNKILQQMVDSFGTKLIDELALGTPECPKGYEPLLSRLHSEFTLEYCACSCKSLGLKKGV